MALQAAMHERDFKVKNTYRFPRMIFCLCRSAGVPILHIDQLKTFLGIVDIGLIRDEANVLYPRRGPRLECPPLGENLADMVVHACTAVHDSSETTNTTPVESIPGSSTTTSFAPYVCFTNYSRITIFLCIGDDCISFCCVLGKLKVCARVKSE